ncbi:MAG: helix-hairpin-helix domain-containing protein [bacterium]
MSLRSDHKALIFVGVVAVLGAGVRVVRAAGRDSVTGAQPALDVQARAADSAAVAQHAARDARKSGRGGKASSRGASDTTRRAHRDTARKAAPPGGPLDRPGHIGGKLDLDVATASQIDSLPGMSSGMAKRIVADRMMRGPFLTRDGLRRVAGMGPRFVQQIDSLVVFSGTFVAPSATDTTIPRPKLKRSKTPMRPLARRTTGPPQAPSLREAEDSC